MSALLKQGQLDGQKKRWGCEKQLKVLIATVTVDPISEQKAPRCSITCRKRIKNAYMHKKWFVWMSPASCLAIAQPRQHTFRTPSSAFDSPEFDGLPHLATRTHLTQEQRRMRGDAQMTGWDREKSLTLAATAITTAQEEDERRRGARERVMILRSQRGTERRGSAERGNRTTPLLKGLTWKKEPWHTRRYAHGDAPKHNQTAHDPAWMSVWCADTHCTRTHVRSQLL